MEQAVRSARLVRFGVYEVDLEAGELRKSGRRISLQEQPFQVLALLLVHPGKLVTREELQKQIWAADTFVDFDLGLNTAIKKIRTALGDSAGNPRFIETLPRRGYRFICPVESIASGVLAAQPPMENAGESGTGPEAGVPSFLNLPSTPPVAENNAGAAKPSKSWRYRLWLALTMLAILSLPVGLSVYRLRGGSGPRAASTDFAMEKLKDQGTRVAAAYESYLKGGDFLQADDMPEKDEKAIQSFAEAVRADPSYALAYAGLGEAYWNKYKATGKDEWKASAQDACNKALDLDARRAAPHLCMGTLHNGMGLYERAVADFSAGLQLDAHSAAAYQGRARAYQSLGKTPEAEKDYIEAIDLDPHRSSGYSALAQLYFIQGRYQEAARKFEQSIEIQPDNSGPRFALGAVYVEMGQYDKAISALEEAARMKPGFGVYENLGTLLLNKRRFEESIQRFQKALELGPNDYRGYGNLARAYFWAPGRRGLARAQYERAIAMAKERLTVNPEDPDVNLSLAVYCAMLGQEDDALYHLDRSMLLRPNAPETAFWASIVHLRLGNRAKALAWLRQARELKFSPAEIGAAPELDSLRQSGILGE